jgi:hypothetical protein
MDQATFERERSLNQRAYEGLRDDLRRRYAGQYVALANARLIAAAPTFEEARAAVERLKPVPEYYLVFPADQDPSFDLVLDL